MPNGHTPAGAPARPLYPIARLLTDGEAAEAHADALVWFGGFPFVSVEGNWALVDDVSAATDD